MTNSSGRFQLPFFCARFVAARSPNTPHPIFPSKTNKTAVTCSHTFSQGCVCFAHPCSSRSSHEMRLKGKTNIGPDAEPGVPVLWFVGTTASSRARKRSEQMSPARGTIFIYGWFLGHRTFKCPSKDCAGGRVWVTARPRATPCIHSVPKQVLSPSNIVCESRIRKLQLWERRAS